MIRAEYTYSTKDIKVEIQQLSAAIADIPLGKFVSAILVQQFVDGYSPENVRRELRKLKVAA